MEIKLVGVIGEKNLYKNRSSNVRKRIVDFINEVTERLVLAFINRTSLKFSWEAYTFNQSQREAIIHFLKINDLIEHYSRGFSFGEENTKLSELHPTPKLFESIVINQCPDVLSEVRNKRDTRILKDTDSKLLGKYVKSLKSNLNIPLMTMKRIYSGENMKGGRIYSAYQSMSAVNRSNLITINGNSVTELDYRNNHINIILKAHGRKIDTDVDLYNLMTDFDIERKEVKRAISAILNAERPMLALTSGYGSFGWSKTNAIEFINRFYTLFPEIKEMKLGSSLGLSLQYIEGNVMMDLIKESMNNDMIILPVHDSAICEDKNKYQLADMMQVIWSDRVTLDTKIIREFIK